MKRSIMRVSGVLAIILLCAATGASAGPTKKQDAQLNIGTDGAGNVVVTWNGKGQLLEARSKNGRYTKVRKSISPYVTAPTAEVASFQLAASDGNVYSANTVGYANLQLPPGLSLIANPLYYRNNSLAFWMPHPPAGAQVYKYTPENGYEVSTFDEIEGVWSNPDLQVPIGEGFFFRNPGDSTVVQTFVGQVLEGWLTNSLPVGYSTKGSMIPANWTLNQHAIPGQPGDEIRTYTNDLQGGGDYNISVYVDTDYGWVPDLTVALGQGFWIHKQHQQDWVRYFRVN